MADEIARASEENTAGATMLLAGFITSALFLVAASILWAGLLIAVATENSGDQNDGGGALIGLGALVNAALFYFWGFYGLRKSTKALKDAVARETAAGNRT
jgi:hypothetical protein